MSGGGKDERLNVERLDATKEKEQELNQDHENLLRLPSHPLRGDALDCEQMRKQSLPGLSKKLWKIVSECVRRKDADENGWVRCFTCGNQHHWKQIHAGHYHASSISLSLRFDERNLRPQCVACNLHRRGNLTQYALGLEKIYGANILQELDADKHKLTKYSRNDYEEMIQAWGKKLKDLDGEIFGAR